VLLNHHEVLLKHRVPELVAVRGTCRAARKAVDALKLWAQLAGALNAANTFNVGSDEQPFVLGADEPGTFDDNCNGHSDQPAHAFTRSDPRIQSSFAQLPPFQQCAKLFPFCCKAVERIQDEYDMAKLISMTTEELQAPGTWEYVEEADGDPDVIQELLAHVWGVYGSPAAGGSRRYRAMYLLSELRVAAKDLESPSGPYWHRDDKDTGCGIDVAHGSSYNDAVSFYTFSVFAGPPHCNVDETEDMDPGDDEHLAWLVRPIEPSATLLRELCGERAAYRLDVLARARALLPTLIAQLREEDPLVAAEALEWDEANISDAESEGSSIAQQQVT
jgi:hypothetical protein